jgi:hypothetical protein
MAQVEFESLMSSGHVQVGAAGCVMLSRYDGLGDLATTLQVQQVALALARRRGTQIGSVVMVGAGRGAVNAGDNAQRSAFLRAMKEVEPHMFATAVVVTSDGFAGAALRAFVSGISLAARSPYPLKVFDGFASARDWIVPLAPRDHREIAAALDAGLAGFVLARPG